MAKYVCAYCGKVGSVPQNVTLGTCPKSPSKSHKVIPEQNVYYCRWCGKKGSSPSAVTSGICPKSPFKGHELLGD